VPKRLPQGIDVRSLSLSQNVVMTSKVYAVHASSFRFVKTNEFKMKRIKLAQFNLENVDHTPLDEYCLLNTHTQRPASTCTVTH